jgi:hypothetical protein
MRVSYDVVINELQNLTEEEVVSSALSILELDSIWGGLSTTGSEKLLPDLGILADILTTITAIRDILAPKITDSDKLLEEVYLLHSLYYKILKKIRGLENYINLFTPIKEVSFEKELRNVELEKANSSSTLKLLALLGE